MRNLARDTQCVYISRYEGIGREVDGQGRLTGKNTPIYTTPAAFYPSLSMARGEAQGAYFGVNLDYDRVLTLDDNSFEVSEADRLWVDKCPPEPHDHVVKKVARKGDFTVVAASRVEVRQ